MRKNANFKNHLRIMLKLPDKDDKKIPSPGQLIPGMTLAINTNCLIGSLKRNEKNKQNLGQRL